MKLISVFLILGLSAVSTGFAQNAQVEFSLKVSDNAGGEQMLYFGLDPGATDSLDAGLGERELPPMPPAGIFDARFVGEDIALTKLGQGTYRDYRQGGLAFAGSVTHELRYQYGSGSEIIISWNLPDGVTGRLKDLFDGAVVNKMMSGKDSLLIDNPGALNKLLMIMTYDLPTVVPSAPGLIEPHDGATDISAGLALRWHTSSTALAYDVQIAGDSLFTDIAVAAHAVPDTFFLLPDLEKNTLYYWRVRGTNEDWEGLWSETWSFRTRMATSVDGGITAAKSFSLAQNYPNPFNPTTTIRFQLNRAADIELAVYDLSGRLVRTLMRSPQRAGMHTLQWDGRDANGQAVASGVYLYRLRSGGQVQVRRMVVLR